MRASVGQPEVDAPGCLSLDTAVAFREHRLDDAHETRVDDHLASCRACRRLLAEVALMSVRETPREPSGSAPSLRCSVPRKLARLRAIAHVGSLLCGRWRVGPVLAEGGTCHVYAGAHRNGRPVAIKMMRPELALDPEHVHRFLREAYTANRVEHPGVVAVLDDDIAADGTPFLVMERLEGETLGTKVRRDGPLGYAEALKAVDTALDVLAAAHAKDIVHRDVKPDNLFVCNDGTLRVLDFGLARSRDAGDDSMTRTGTQMGTVGYVSPEQARGQHDALDARSDVWSVGATLYTLLTGCILHRESTSNEGFLRAMSTPVRPMRELAPHVPASLARLLDTALAFDPSERFASGAVMRAALAKVDINDAPVSVPTPRRWRRALAVALCAACVGLASSLGFPDAVSVPVRRAREVSYARATRAEVASAPRKAAASLGRAAVRPSADVPVRTLPAEPVRDPYALRK